MTPLVQKGNTIHVPAEYLGGDKSQKVTVSWSQRMLTRTQDYWVCAYTVKSGGNSEGVVYIQTDKLDEFKSKKTDGDDLILTVDEQFQYGQDKALTKRFLVFHNKDNKPYQHRFVENTLTKIGGHAADIVGLLGYEDLGDSAENLAKAWVGDYLHNY